MTFYKFLAHDKNYTSWDMFDMLTNSKQTFTFDPVKHKLFNGDIFSLPEQDTVRIEHSIIRTGSQLPGVLILADNKTYGRKKKKLLYKCVPDDIRLPSFLIPYEMKQIGFSKVFVNLYVTFSCVDWKDKHPNGILNHVIGNIDILDNFYEYQLYRKSLNNSLQQFQKDAIKAINTNKPDDFIHAIKIKYPSIEDRIDQVKWPIFSIDPSNSLDLDDAFSVQYIDANTTKLSIYISNVTVWIDVLNLWDSLSRRISTIYLPDKKRPMLPTNLSECLCSLISNITRVAFYIDISITDNLITDIKYGNCFVKLYKNYTYDESALLKDANYTFLFETTTALSHKYKYMNFIKNSHDVVSYLMILMNYKCAKSIVSHNVGIFRSTVINKDTIVVPDTIPHEVSNFIKITNSTGGVYINGATITNNTIIKHEFLDVDAYIHITSPIRRLVDLLNIIKFQEVHQIIKLSDKAYDFYNRWLGDIDYINVTMKSIRKIQVDCNLLDRCYQDKNIINQTHNGYIFNKISKNDGMFQYIVYLPDLKLSSRITVKDEYNNFENHKFNLFLFQDEDTFKRKIRLQIVK